MQPDWKTDYSINVHVYSRRIWEYIIHYFYYVKFSTGIFPGEKYPVKSHPETSDFQHLSEDIIVIIIIEDIIIIVIIIIIIIIILSWI